MNELEQIETLLAKWKADIKTKKHGANKDRRRFAMGVVSGLESALAIFKKPSNTAMQIDTKPCANCNFYKTNVHFHFCPDCGLALSD